jgi:hypothetical protein
MPFGSAFRRTNTGRTQVVSYGGGTADHEDTVLFIEYDVTPDGAIEVVALINATEQDDDDVDGSAWMAWRVEQFDDNGLGCVGVPPDELALMEETDDEDDDERLRAIVERLILADRATKELERS